jgi:hypothetical protein
MPTDISLTKHALAVLHAMSGSSLPQQTLGSEMEIRASRLLTTSEIADTIAFCQDRGWLDSRKDDFGRTLWRITDAGINRLRDL